MAKLINSIRGALPGFLPFQAVALAVQRFRKGNWSGQPGPGCEFCVEVREASPIAYKIALAKVEQFARHGTVRGPQDILRKEHLRKLLGITD
jgi:hypothetical protein